VLEIKHLTKIYEGGVQALEDVSLTVDDGEFLVIIGLSGSGKSTLMRCINRLVEPTAGQIIYNGVDVTAASQEELRLIRRRIGMIFQHFNLVKRSTVLTNVLSGRLGYVNPWTSLLHRFSEEDLARAMADLRRVGIEEKAYARADELSGGQQQRVGIARALMQEPELVLAGRRAGLGPRPCDLTFGTQVSGGDQPGRRHHGDLHPPLFGPGPALWHAYHRAQRG